MKRNAMRLMVLLLALALLCPAALAEADAPEAPVAQVEALDEPVMELEIELNDDAEPSDDADETPTETEAVEEAEEIIEAETAPADAIESEVVEAEDYVYGEFELDVHELILGVGEKFELYPSSGGPFPTFESSDTKVAKVSDDGTVQAAKTGSCIIHARRDGVDDYCEIIVMKAPKSVSLNYKTIDLGFDSVRRVGESFDLEVTLPDGSASNLIELDDYDGGIIRIDDDNRVTAIGPGTTQLAVRTFNKKKATMTVNVVAAPSSMSFDKDFLSLGEGATSKLKLVLPEGTGGKFSYYSENTCIAQVDANGVVTGRNVGTTTIVAECFNGTSAACIVDVVPAPSWIDADPDNLVLGVGETVPITVLSDVNELSGGLTFTSTKTKYATVSAAGVIKGVKKGKSVIQVNSYNGCYDEVNVEVLKAPSKVTLDRKTLIIGVDETDTLVATLPKDSTGSMTWTSSNPNVVDVDDDGYLMAMRSGKATITVKTYNNKTDTCNVTVIAPAEAINVNDYITIEKGKSITKPFEVLDTNGNVYQGSAQVEFDPVGIARFENNQLKGVRVGDTMMTIIAGNIEAYCYVTVDSPGGYKYFTNEPQIFAHRGGAGDSGETENTLDAFWAALNTGADGVELDVHSTKDGVQVIHHDATFKVGTKTYTIKKMKYAELIAKKPEIPTLDEALDVLKAIDAKIFLEMKASANGKKCVEAIRRHGLQDRTIYFGFYDTPLKDVYKADPNATLGLSLDKGVNPVSSSSLKKASKLHITILVTHMGQVNESSLQKAHEEGYMVSVWTPDSVSDCLKFYDMGVDFILTDYPSYVTDYR